MPTLSLVTGNNNDHGTGYLKFWHGKDGFDDTLDSPSAIPVLHLFLLSVRSFALYPALPLHHWQRRTQCYLVFWGIPDFLQSFFRNLLATTISRNILIPAAVSRF